MVGVAVGIFEEYVFLYTQSWQLAARVLVYISLHRQHFLSQFSVLIYGLPSIEMHDVFLLWHLVQPLKQTSCSTSGDLFLAYLGA